MVRSVIAPSTQRSDRDCTPGNGTEFPYLLVAPDYRESSLGVQVVHYLCHCLNLRGFDARMVGCTVNPQWNTPQLLDADYQQMIADGRTFIAVYPEVVSGDPLSAPVAVRYMLNREGVICDNAVEAGEDDLWFWYRQEFADKEADPQLLRPDMQDLELFRDDGADKDLDLLYLNRVPASAVDFSTLPDGIRVLSMDNPLSLVELAAVLKRGRVLYSYESSGTFVLANLCGCPVVARSAPGYEYLAINPTTLHDNGDGGVAWQDDAASLAQVRSQLGQVRDYYLQLREVMERQLDNFIRLTLRRAKQAASQRPLPQLAAWQAARRLHPRQLAQLKMTPPAAAASLTIVIACADADAAATQSTLDSLAQARAQGANVVVMLTGPASLPLLPEWVSVSSATTGVAQLNDTLRQQPARWLLCVDAGCRFIPDGLLAVQYALQTHQGWGLYADELQRDEQGELTARFRSGYNRDLLLSLPGTMARHWLLRSDALLAAGGFAEDLASASELDAILRLLSHHGASGIAHLAEPLLEIGHVAPLDPQPVQNSLQRYLQREGYPHARAEPLDGASWRIHYGHQQGAAVSILIAAGDKLPLLERCLQNLFGNTDWPHYEVIVACEDGCPEAIVNWLAAAAAQLGERLRVIPGGGSGSALLNRAAEHAAGEYLLLLDVTALVVQQHWLKNMLNHALRREVGCVGSMLINFEQRVISAGLVLGCDAVVADAFAGSALGEPGDMQRLLCDQNYSAVNGACLLVRRTLWQQAGGWQSGLARQRWAEVDLCLKVAELGYLTVWTPHAVMALDRPIEDGPQPAQEIVQRTLFLQRWLPQLACDPAWNRHLSTRVCNGTPEWESSLFRPRIANAALPRVLALYRTGGVGGSLLRDPLTMLADRGELDLLSRSAPPGYPLLARSNPEVLLLQTPPDPAIDDWVHHVKLISPRFTVSLLHPDTALDDRRSVVQRGGLDRLLTHSAEGAEALSKRHHDVRLLPLCLPERWRGLACERHPAERMRVLCLTVDCGAGDLALLSHVVRELHHQVEWVVLGPVPPHWLPWIAENHRFGGSERFPQQLCALNVELALVPREDSRNNRYRHPLVLLALAACGIAAVCSDVSSLRNHLPFTRTRNGQAQWMKAVAEHLSERDATRQHGLQLPAMLREDDWLHQGQLAHYLSALLPA